MSEEGSEIEMIGIGGHLHALATSQPLPVAALAMCTIRIDQAGPVLRATLARAAAGDILSEDDATLLFRGLHVLGAARDTQACEPLLLLLRRPAEEVDALLGDAITETLPRIVAGVFNGDAEALLEAIADRSIDEFVRDALLGAATFLAWDGRIDSEQMRCFLARFHQERLADNHDQAWYAWQQATALLGLRSLQPMVRQVFREGLMPEHMLDPEDFEADLAEAERAPASIGRFKRAHLGYIDDIGGALAWTDQREGASLDPYEPLWESVGRTPAMPVINPWRSVGRNDPCPCGSGRKFKKCCAGA